MKEKITVTIHLLLQNAFILCNMATDLFWEEELYKRLPAQSMKVISS
jgi:hypothetical protein